MKEWLKGVLFGIGISLLISFLFLVSSIIWSIKTDDLSGATYWWIGPVAVGFGSLASALRFRYNPLLGVLIGYLFTWSNLILVNESIALAALDRSFFIFLLLLFTLPWSTAVSGIIGSFIGIYIRHNTKRIKE